MEFRILKIAVTAASLIFLPSYKLNGDHRPRFIVWNVGQGQWITISTSTKCLHIDMGGEKNPSKDVFEECGGKINSIELTHADWDHMSFIPWAMRRWQGLCLFHRPRENLNEKKTNLLMKLETCPSDDRIKEVFTTPPSYFKKPNDLSRVFLAQDQKILIPGDSSSRAEKIWGRKPIRAKILLLGHHGSRTSTSEFLLRNLPSLQMAIASQRKEKYGHPHPDVVQRLARRRLPLLTTESWGHLRLEL